MPVVGLGLLEGCNFNITKIVFRNEVTGMTRKAFTQVQKVAVIVAAAREALEQMEEETPSPFLYPQCQAKFEVIANDVKAAYGLIKLSMHAYKCFKVHIKFLVHMIWMILFRRISGESWEKEMMK